MGGKLIPEERVWEKKTFIIFKGPLPLEIYNSHDSDNDHDDDDY
jgi:hypothetical protein